MTFHNNCPSTAQSPGRLVHFTQLQLLHGLDPEWQSDHTTCDPVVRLRQAAHRWIETNVAFRGLHADDAGSLIEEVVRVVRHNSGDDLSLHVDLPTYGPWWFAAEDIEPDAFPADYLEFNEPDQLVIVDLRS